MKNDDVTPCFDGVTVYFDEVVSSFFVVAVD
jgi:hypothetical protein